MYGWFVFITLLLCLTFWPLIILFFIEPNPETNTEETIEVFYVTFVQLKGYFVKDIVTNENKVTHLTKPYLTKNQRLIKYYEVDDRYGFNQMRRSHISVYYEMGDIVKVHNDILRIINESNNSDSPNKADKADKADKALTELPKYKKKMFKTNSHLSSKLNKHYYNKLLEIRVKCPELFI